MKPSRERSTLIGGLAILALRNLGAQKRRTLAVVASLACGISALCIIGGYYEYS